MGATTIEKACPCCQLGLCLYTQLAFLSITSRSLPLSPPPPCPTFLFPHAPRAFSCRQSSVCGLRPAFQSNRVSLFALCFAACATVLQSEKVSTSVERDSHARKVRFEAEVQNHQLLAALAVSLPSLPSIHSPRRQLRAATSPLLAQTAYNQLSAATSSNITRDGGS